MKRMKNFFAISMLIVGLVVWHLLDWAMVTIPWKTPLVLFQLGWAGIFMLIPLNLLYLKHKWWINLSILASLTGLFWLSSPFTDQTTIEPSQTHCSRSSFAGFFHPIRNLLPPAYQDDLEAKNQICWVIKMVKKISATIPQEDLAHHLNLMKNKLMKPELKYRVTIPWITVLLGNYGNASGIQNGPLLIQNLGFWSNLYTEEISMRNYQWYDYPMAWITQIEYGFIERNWENLKIEFNSGP